MNYCCMNQPGPSTPPGELSTTLLQAGFHDGHAHSTARSIACCVVAVVSNEERSIICCSKLWMCGSSRAMRARRDRDSTHAWPSVTARHWFDLGLRNTKSRVPTKDPGPACASRTFPCALGIVLCHCRGSTPLEAPLPVPWGVVPPRARGLLRCEITLPGLWGGELAATVVGRGLLAIDMWKGVLRAADS